MTDIKTQFEKIDWAFSNSSKDSIHNIHPYPAKFIPEIPRTLLKLFYNHNDSIVLDPFCGSGTTLVEAINKGINAIGIDINPIACLISRVKTTPLQGNLNDFSQIIINKAKNNISTISIPEIPKLDHWFKKDIQHSIASLIYEIELITEETIKNALKLALSSIIVRVSNQDSDTRYAAVENVFTQSDVFNLFKESVYKINKIINQYNYNLLRFHNQKIGKTTIIQNDILGVKPSELPHNIGLVITSPPYPNAYEYWLYHKYRMYWLDMDPISVREGEIGARPHYHGKNPQDENNFKYQMSKVFELLSSVMLNESKACFVIGDSFIRGKKIDNAELLTNSAQKHGFNIYSKIERRIPKNRSSFNPVYSSRKKEYIVVYELNR